MIGRMTRAFGADDVARLPAKSKKRRLLMIADKKQTQDTSAPTQVSTRKGSCQPDGRQSMKSFLDRPWARRSGGRHELTRSILLHKGTLQQIHEVATNAETVICAYRRSRRAHSQASFAQSMGA